MSEKGFSVHRRNPGHWDICDEKQRVYRIRGEAGEVVLIDERIRGAGKAFRTVNMALAYAAAELMFEVGHP